MPGKSRRLAACALSGAALLLTSCGEHPTAPSGNPPLQPVPNYSGIYILTITAGAAAGPCAPTFPEAAKRRVYRARLQQRAVIGAPYLLEVSLTGADFVFKHGGAAAFTGTFGSTGGDIRFRIHDAYPGDPWWPFPSDAQVVERLSDGTQLVIVGDIIASGTPGSISGKGGVLDHSTAGRCAIEGFVLEQLRPLRLLTT